MVYQRRHLELYIVKQIAQTAAAVQEQSCENVLTGREGATCYLRVERGPLAKAREVEGH